MHYVAIVDGEERQVEITEKAPDRYQVFIDSQRFEVDARAVSDSTLSLMCGDQSYNIELERAHEGGHNLLVRGHVVHVEVLDLRRMRLRRAQQSVTSQAGPATITAPMPGKVVAVLAKTGDEVEEGQGVVVVEAMKMENELRAPKSGVLKGLSVSEGEAVEGGAVLCTIE